MRSWPFYAKSLAWMPSPAIDSLRRAYLCRGSPERGAAIDARRRMFLCRGPREGNSDRRERRPIADQPHSRAPTPPARGPVPDNN
jgi:hypothetical protein